MPAFDWNRYLDLSIQLYQEQDAALREAALRSSVSRAFYAAFILARNNARDNHKAGMTGTSEDYKIVFNFYKRSNPYITPDLQTLQDWRHLCDYIDELNNLEQLAENAIQVSQSIISKLPKPKPQIINNR